MQNNSGGYYQINDKVASIVIIEADSALQANEIAESLGIYFDGVSEGIDCPCCGDRWYPVEDRDRSDFPEIYREPVQKYSGFRAKSDKVQPFLHIHRKGSTETFWTSTKK